MFNKAILLVFSLVMADLSLASNGKFDGFTGSDDGKRLSSAQPYRVEEPVSDDSTQNLLHVGLEAQFWYLCKLEDATIREQEQRENEQRLHHLEKVRRQLEGEMRQEQDNKSERIFYCEQTLAALLGVQKLYIQCDLDQQRCLNGVVEVIRSLRAEQQQHSLNVSYMEPIINQAIARSIQETDVTYRARMHVWTREQKELESESGNGVIPMETSDDDPRSLLSGCKAKIAVATQALTNAQAEYKAITYKYINLAAEQSARDMAEDEATRLLRVKNYGLRFIERMKKLASLVATASSQQSNVALLEDK